MNFETVMQELEDLSKPRMKKIYLSNGAQEPLFGVTTGEMKPMSKKIKKNQPLAEGFMLQVIMMLCILLVLFRTPKL